MSVSGTINQSTESASFTYDVLGRLWTSSQTMNGTSTNRTFAYDRWANRTGVWDDLTGTHQIQSAALQQSGGAPTNRLTSVTTNGVQANYSYDSAGNVTNDGQHTYVYDGENRLAAVDGSAQSYGYDQKNRRIKEGIGRGDDTRRMGSDQGTGRVRRQHGKHALAICESGRASYRQNLGRGNAILPE